MKPAVWYTDSATLRIVHADDAAVELLGYSRDELIGMNARNLVELDSQHEIDAIRDLGRWGDGGAHTFIRKDGSRFIASVRWHQGYYLGHCCDFTIVSHIRDCIAETSLVFGNR